MSGWNDWPMSAEELEELARVNRAAAEKEAELVSSLPAWAQAKIARLEAEVSRNYRELYGAGREEALGVHEHKVDGGLRFASPAAQTVAVATGELEVDELVIEIRASSDVSVELEARNVARVVVKAPRPLPSTPPALAATPYVCRCPGRPVPHKIGEARCEFTWPNADAVPPTT